MEFNFSKLTHKQLYSMTIITSLLFSLIYSLKTPFVNRDGIYYIEIAQYFDTYPFRQFFQLYWHQWPFYSMLLKVFYSFSPFSWEITAYLVNACTLSTTLVILLYLSKNMTTIKSDHLWIAAGLFLCCPSLNETRSSILREPCAWFCLTGSMHYLLIYLEQKKFIHCLCCFLLLGISSLFRVEYLAYLMLVPSISVGLICIISKEEKVRTLKAYYAPFVLFSVLIICGYFTMHYQPKIMLSRLSELLSAPHDLVYFLGKNISQIQTFLPRESHSFSKIFLLSGLTSMFIYKIILSFTLPICLFMFILFCQKRSAPYFKTPSARLVWLSYFITAFIVPYFILLKHAILPNRMLTMICILSLIPFAVHCSQLISHLKKPLDKKILLLIIFPFLIANFNAPSKKHLNMQQAINWIKTKNPSCLISDNKKLQYYSGFLETDPHFFSALLHRDINAIDQSELDSNFKQFIKQQSCQDIFLITKFKKIKELDYFKTRFKYTKIKIFPYKQSGYAVFELDRHIE